MSLFARGFRLLTPDGRVFDGAELPSGRGIVVDHRETGFVTLVADRDALLAEFPGARIEWAPQPPTA
jgi:hypothetical protein